MMPEYLTLTGSLRASQESEVAADATGKVTATFVERGQKVKQGVVPNGDGKLRPGMFAVGMLSFGEKKSTVVPTSSLKKDETGARVFIVIDKARRCRSCSRRSPRLSRIRCSTTSRTW